MAVMLFNGLLCEAQRFLMVICQYRLPAACIFVKLNKDHSGYIVTPFFFGWVHTQSDSNINYVFRAFPT